MVCDTQSIHIIQLCANHSVFCFYLNSSRTWSKMKFSKHVTPAFLCFINQTYYHFHWRNRFFLGNEDTVESIMFDRPDAAVVFHVQCSLDHVIAARVKRRVLLLPQCSIMHYLRRPMKVCCIALGVFKYQLPHVKNRSVKFMGIECTLNSYSTQFSFSLFHPLRLLWFCFCVQKKVPSAKEK